MRIFAEMDLRAALENQLASVRKEVHAEDKHKLLNMNEAEYIHYLVDKYKVEPLVLHWDAMIVSDREVMIPAERFPFNFNVYAGKSYPKQVITYHIPFSGEHDLLRCYPSSIPLWSMDVDVSHNSISFDIVNWRDSPEEIKREADSAISHIRQRSESVASVVNNFNASVEGNITTIVSERKAEHLKQLGLLGQLGVPLKKASNVPKTFAVPIVRKKVAVKPVAPSSTFTPELTLDESIYIEILQICHETGVEMERHPSIYNGKDEESLRDYFIMVLSPHFDSVTGETFNKSGKTDILVRHEKSNVFVAECKFWKGAKGFHETIDQVLGYLTWRDSKAAILLFVRTKELETVLTQIEPAAARHPCFGRSRGRRSESWYDFDFHLIGDASRGVRLAVLCFHFPPQAE